MPLIAEFDEPLASLAGIGYIFSLYRPLLLLREEQASGMIFLTRQIVSSI